MKIQPIQPIYRIPKELPKKTKEERIEDAKYVGIVNKSKVDVRI